MRKSILLAAGVLCATLAHAGDSAFKQRIMSKPQLKGPDKPFVMVFFEGGEDNNKYGFRSGGDMSIDDWADVLNHVGFLSPYSDFKPGDKVGWNVHRRDIAVRGAIKAGRKYIGGSIMGCPRNDEQAKHVIKGYADEIGTQITHYFHDYEPHYNSIGGSGNIFEYDLSKAGIFSTAPSADFNPGVGKAMESFTISFDYLLRNYIFGGSLQLMNCSDNNFTIGMQGWGIVISNQGGHGGRNYMTFYGRDRTWVQSAPLNSAQGKAWHHVEITVDGSAKGDMVDVTINIDNAHVSSGQVKRPRAQDWAFNLGQRNQAKERQPRFDNIQIKGVVDGKERLIAEYDAETPINDGVIKDASGNGHELKFSGKGEYGWVARPQENKREREMMAYMQKYLVDAILDIRKEKGLPAPELINNWLIGDAKGRFAHMKQCGFTNASTASYLYGDIQPDMANFTRILKLDRHKWNREEGSKWIQTWTGVFKSSVPLSPEQWQSVMTLSILDGVRWFSVFTAMSDGHLGSNTWKAPQDAVKMAEYNADCLYAQAIAASWFEPYADSLMNSEWVQLPEAGKFPGILQARKNDATKEMWFAAWSVNNVKQEIKLSATKGAVINMTNGKEHKISDGKFIIDSGNFATPYYFKPTK